MSLLVKYVRLGAGRDLTCVQAYRVVTVSGFHKNFLPRVRRTLKKAGHLKFSLESYRGEPKHP